VSREVKIEYRNQKYWVESDEEGFRSCKLYDKVELDEAARQSLGLPVDSTEKQEAQRVLDSVFGPDRREVSRSGRRPRAF
jgi:hypothetical protein